jgi:ketosteroid isomerase-like protein
MSQDSVEVVRTPLRLRERPSRPLDQRLLVRFPRLAVVSAQLLNRLSPRSRLRRAVLSRASVLAIEDVNRGEYDLALVSKHPHCEYRPPREMIEAGLVQSCYRGHAGYRELMTDWSHAGDLHLEDVELLDLGDRLVLLAALALRWRQRADNPFSRKWACVITLDGGRAIREQYYWNHAEALEAVGLRE